MNILDVDKIGRQRALTVPMAPHCHCHGIVKPQQGTAYRTGEPNNRVGHGIEQGTHCSNAIATL